MAKANKTLEYISRHDNLTGLPTRRYFYEQLRSFVEEDPNIKANLLLIDFDDFKNINNQCGHLMGDKGLPSASTILKDVTDEHTIVARFGGEEFMVLRRNEDMNKTKIFAKDLAKTIKNFAYDLPNYDIIITVSIGLATFDATENDALNRAFKRADEALYSAKNAGKNQIKIYNDKD